MKGFISSKTHRFIKVRKFPSKYILDKFHNNDKKAIITFHKYGEKYRDFYQSFIGFAMGKPYQYYQDNYIFETSIITKEILHEKTGILIAEAGNHHVYCIPKTIENEKLFDYIIKNVPVKYKVLKKTWGSYYDYGPTKYYREQYKEINDKYKNIINNE